MDEICGDYVENVMELFSSCPSEVLDPIKQSILQSAESLGNMAPPVIKLIIDVLVEKSMEVILASYIEHMHYFKIEKVEWSG